jgi:hypothetical protein
MLVDPYGQSMMSNRVRDYWLTAETFCTLWDSNIMKFDWLQHLLRFINFSKNMNQQDKNGNNYDRLQKITTLFNHLNNIYAKFYSQSEHLAVDEVNVFFTGRTTFKQ